MDIETEWAVLPPPPGPEHPNWEKSWGHLFHTYTPAMRAYVRAMMSRRLRRSVSIDEADEIVQEYLAVCMDKGWLSREAGKIRQFRAYLKTQLYRFTCDQLDHRLARKRNPDGVAPVEVLEGVSGEEPDPSDAAAFDAEFVQAAMNSSLAKLRAVNEEHAEVIRDLLRTAGEGSADLAERLGRDAKSLGVLRHRARKAFAVLLATELKGTCLDLASYAGLLEGLDRYLP